MTTRQKIGGWVLFVIAVCGCYGTYATYGSGWDQGRAPSCLADNDRERYQKGFDTGLQQGKREAGDNANAEAQVKLTAYKADIDQQYQQAIEKAFQQGVNEGEREEARLVIQHDIQFGAKTK